MSTNRQKYIDACEYLKKYNVKVAFNHININPYWGQESAEKYNFEILLNSQVFYFSQGYKKFGRNKKMTLHDFELQKRRNDAANTYPDLWGFINCVISDSDAIHMSFNDWCANFGYDSDSRKALKTYEDCQSQTRCFLNALGIKSDEIQNISAYLEIIGEN